jgi:hypothetical protein
MDISQLKSKHSIYTPCLNELIPFKIALRGKKAEYFWKSVQKAINLDPITCVTDKTLEGWQIYRLSFNIADLLDTICTAILTDYWPGGEENGDIFLTIKTN